MNSFRFSGLFVVVFNCILVCSIVFMFNHLSLLFCISSNSSFNVHEKIKASGSHSMNEKSDSGFRSDPAILLQAPSLPKALKDIVASCGADSDFKTILAFKAEKTTASKQTTKRKKCENTREKGAGNKFETSTY